MGETTMPVESAWPGEALIYWVSPEMTFGYNKRGVVGLDVGWL